jgi:hypothetical protein
MKRIAAIFAGLILFAGCSPATRHFPTNTGPPLLRPIEAPQTIDGLGDLCVDTWELLVLPRLYWEQRGPRDNLVCLGSTDIPELGDFHELVVREGDQVIIQYLGRGIRRRIAIRLDEGEAVRRIVYAVPNAQKARHDSFIAAAFGGISHVEIEQDSCTFRAWELRGQFLRTRECEASLPRLRVCVATELALCSHMRD